MTAAKSNFSSFSTRDEIQICHDAIFLMLILSFFSPIYWHLLIHTARPRAWIVCHSLPRACRSRFFFFLSSFLFHYFLSFSLNKIETFLARSSFDFRDTFRDNSTVFQISFNFFTRTNSILFPAEMNGDVTRVQHFLHQLEPPKKCARPQLSSQIATQPFLSHVFRLHTSKKCVNRKKKRYIHQKTHTQLSS